MTLFEPLTQIGFTFSKSTLIFKRKINGFVQTINFQLNRYNQEYVCAEFWTSFGVSSNVYSKWHKEEFCEKPINDSLGGAMDWNIKGWEFPIIDNKRELHFQIIDENERENVMTVLKKNFLNIGIPYLDRLSNWENAANEIVESECSHYKACDFFLIAGLRDKALWALEQGLDCWERKPKGSFPEDRDKIKIRLKKYFGK
ncbi:hypothetical protein SRABI04_04298 [Chryseobacterium sp. Bi04]|nr:hypothetical protein SRABI04_04298 [Chryseobacterium sp. Bi04]